MLLIDAGIYSKCFLNVNTYIFILAGCILHFVMNLLKLLGMPLNPFHLDLTKYLFGFGENYPLSLGYGLLTKAVD